MFPWSAILSAGAKPALTAAQPAKGRESRQNKPSDGRRVPSEVQVQVKRGGPDSKTKDTHAHHQSSPCSSRLNAIKHFGHISNWALYSSGIT